MNRDNVFFIYPVYIMYRKMWKENRWKFSGEMVRMTIKENNGTITESEKERLKTMNRIVDENNGEWVDNPNNIYRKRITH